MADAIPYRITAALAEAAAGVLTACDHNRDPADAIESLREPLALFLAAHAHPPFRMPAPQGRPPKDPPELERLFCNGGPVALTHENTSGIGVVGHFRTIADAVAYLDASPRLNATDRARGCYGVDAPHGLGSDLEAVAAAKRLGFNVFWSMGSPFYAPPGVAISGNDSGKGWKAGGQTIEEAALRALASVDPDDAPMSERDHVAQDRIDHLEGVHRDESDA